MKQRFFLFLVFWGGMGLLSAQPCLPEIIVLNGIVVNIGPVDLDGDQMTETVGATLRVSDFVLHVDNPCSAVPVQVTLAPGWSTAPGNDTTIFFGADALGPQIVRIWADDGLGHVCFVDTYVLVWDDSAWSEGPAPVYSTACAEDLIPPTLVLLNGLSTSFLPDGNGGAAAKIYSSMFVRRRSDNCGDAAVSRDRLTKGDFPFTGALPRTGTQTVLCPDEAGTILAEVFSEDLAGNVAHPATYMITEDGNDICAGNNIIPSCSPDNMPPEVFLYHGLATYLLGNLTVTVQADQFILKMSDRCGPVTAVRISKAGTVSTPPATTALTFSCSELGTQPVDIWVSDAAGNWSRTTTYVLVQSNCNNCGPDPESNAGTKRYWPAALDPVMERLSKGRRE